jgi:hypothetical protein
MENFSDFDVFLYDIQSGNSGEPRTLEQIKASWPKEPTDAERCRQLAKDASVERPSDPFEIEGIIAQTRILKAISEPVAPGQVFNAATGEPLGKRAESKPVEDDLMRLLDLEREPQATFHGFETVPADRITVAPGPALRKRAEGASTSFLSQPVGDVFEAVARRSTGRAAEFAREVSKQARDLEVA